MKTHLFCYAFYFVALILIVSNGKIEGVPVIIIYIIGVAHISNVFNKFLKWNFNHKQCKIPRK